MQMNQDRHPRGVLIGEPVSKSNGSSIRDFEDGAYNDLLS